MSDIKIEESIRQIISWIRDISGEKDTTLEETPKRVASLYKEIFSGYKEDPKQVLSKTFKNCTSDYNEMILLRDIDFTSTCEHHFLPIIGKISIAYIPDGKVVGISKLARIVNIYSRRLQMQERLTADISNALQTFLSPKGTAVSVQGYHFCMSIRGVQKKNAYLYTNHFTGEFQTIPERRREFLDAISSPVNQSPY